VLRASGVADVFGPGTVIPVAALRLLDRLDRLAQRLAAKGSRAVA